MMALTNIDAPAEYYPNPDQGRPVFNGEMYIGEPDQLPQDFPKSVVALQENGSTVPVAQPIAIGPGGVPVDSNGNPFIQLQVDGNYSQQVLDRNGQQVYYIPNRFNGTPVTTSDFPEIIYPYIIRLFDSVADMQAATDLTVGDAVLTGGTLWEITSDVTQTPITAGDYARPKSDIVAADFGDESVKATVLTALNAREGFEVILNDVSVNQFTIPTDFSSMQEAIGELDFIQNPEKAYDIFIEALYQPTSGVVLADKNYGWVTISSADAVVTLDPTFDVNTDFISLSQCKYVTLNCLIDSQGRCRYGVNCQNDSEITINPGCGVNNTAQRGIYLNQGAYATATDSLFTGCGSVVSTGLNRAAWIARGSTLIAEGADFSDSEGVGLYISRASTVHAMDIKVNNASDEAIWVHRASRLTAHSVFGAGVELSNKSGSAFPVVRIARSSIVALNADAGTAPVTITQNGTGAAIEIINSTLDITEADLVDGSATGSAGINFSGNAIVNASRATITEFTNAALGTGGSLNAPLVAISNARSNGINISRSECNVASASVTGSGSLDLFVQRGSFMRADSCTTTNGPGSPALADTNVPAFNALTNRGILFT